MMVTHGMNMELFNPKTDAEATALECHAREYSIAFIKDEDPIGHFTLITPSAVQLLVDNNIQVWMQHGFAAQTQYSDMDYANVGVDFMDDFAFLAHSTKLLVKFMPFTIRQLELMKDHQIIFSMQLPLMISKDYVNLLNKKKITALAINFIHDEDGVFMTDKIITETISNKAISLSMSAFIVPILMSVVLNVDLRSAMLSVPSLMQSTYCYKGHLCSKEIAEQLHLPWKDILSLCWDMN